jgi:large subunit ribosomal protein L10
MEGPRPEKVVVVDELRERLGGSAAVLLTEYRGLKVSELEMLRRALRVVGGEYKIYKNTLVRRAVGGTDYATLEELLVGPSALTFVEGDVAAVAKALRDFARGHPALVVKGGVIGRSLIDSRGAAALADLPPRDILLAQLAGALAAPMRQFAGLLQALPQHLAYGLSALVDKREAEQDPAVARGEKDDPVLASSSTEAAVAREVNSATAEEAAEAVGAGAGDPTATEPVPVDQPAADEPPPAAVTASEPSVTEPPSTIEPPVAESEAAEPVATAKAVDSAADEVAPAPRAPAEKAPTPAIEGQAAESEGAPN